MKKWNLVVDVAECTNCNNCFIACKDEYVGNEFPGYSAPQPLHGHKWINILKKERGRYPTVDVAYVPTMCNHCDDAPCVKQGNGAVIKRSDGIVIIDPDKAVNRKDIVASCPYGAIWWNDEYKVPQIWSFDAHLIDHGWQQPRCVQTCPTGALKAIKVTDAEMGEIAKSEGLEALRPEFNTKPRVLYKNLHLFNKVFVAGEVLATVDGVIDCLSEAAVELHSQGKLLASARTDEFGEFKIDGLSPRAGACELRVSHTGLDPISITLSIEEESVVLNALMMSR